MLRLKLAIIFLLITFQVFCITYNNSDVYSLYGNKKCKLIRIERQSSCNESNNNTFSFQQVFLVIFYFRFKIQILIVSRTDDFNWFNIHFITSFKVMLLY